LSNSFRERWLFLIFHATVAAQETEITTQAVPGELSNSTETQNENEPDEKIENPTENENTEDENETQNATTTETPLIRPITSSPDASGFDFGSFIGGAVLAFGVTATVYFGIKFYRAHNPDYRHI
jgi:hypothetical protein